MDQKGPYQDAPQDGSKQGVFSQPKAPCVEQVKSSGDASQQDYDGAHEKGYWSGFLKVGVDRHVELILGVLVAIFACFQLVASCNNSKSSTQQTDQLIAASGLAAYAAQQNVQASQNFAQSARGINQGISDAVGRLQLQATNTQELADNALRQADATRALASEAGKQADAAKVQSQAAIDLAAETKALANSAEQQLNSSERPWMKVDLTLNKLPEKVHLSGQSSPVFFDKDGLHVSVLFEAKNVGASPATHVYVSTDLTPSNNRPFIERRQQELCESMHNLSLSIDFNMGEGDTVFAGDPYIVPQYMSLSSKVIAGELQKPSNRTFRGPDGTTLVLAGSDDSFDGPSIIAMQQLGMLPAPSVFVVGCLDYSADFSKTRYQTPFYFELQGLDFRNPRTSRVVLTRNPMWGNNAK